MVSVEWVTRLLAWSTVINTGMLLFATVMLVALRPYVMRIHSKMLGLDEQDLGREYFRYLANYKIAIIVFNLVPYLAARLIG